MASSCNSPEKSGQKNGLPAWRGLAFSTEDQPNRESFAALLRASSSAHSLASHIIALIEASSTAIVTPSIQAKYHMAIPFSKPICRWRR
jgi:hypothetical protein